MRAYRGEDYVRKFANNIEYTVNMSDTEISSLSPTQFRHLLKNQYFAKKRYRYGQTEPSDKQIRVLSKHYGLKVPAKVPTYVKPSVPRPPKEKIGYYTSKRTRQRVYVADIKTNIRGRAYDGRTGRFVKTHKQN